MLRFKIDHDPQTQADAHFLRQMIFVEEQGIPSAWEFDELDTPERLFLVGYLENQPVACARFLLEEPQQLRPDRVCVAQTFRGQGIGLKLMARLEQEGRMQKCTQAVLHAEETATGFYKKIGYHIVGLPFLEDGILCVRMEKTL